MKMLAIFLLLFLPSIVVAQSTIKGRVINVATGNPLPGSSVFINGTSKGTTTDNAGNFLLNEIPAGKHELIISSVGYETNVFSFTDDKLPLQLKVEMVIKVKELDNVIIEESVKEGWDKWGKTFTENLIGITANAAHCQIRNQKNITFRYYKKSNRLVAYTDEPIIIENKALGYIITYQLESFEVNFHEKTMFYTGYSFFEPIDKDRKGLQKKWEKNRLDAYKGSIPHFMKALFANNLTQEGFEVRRMVRTVNEEKLRVKNVYKSLRTVQNSVVNGKTTVQVTNAVSNLPPDTLDYYQRVLEQKDYKDVYGTQMLSADSLTSEKTATDELLHFDDYIFVTYTKKAEEEGYAASQMPARRPTFPRSYVTLLNDKLLMVDKSGYYFNPQDFFTSGYWGWSEKMANSLPMDYLPTE